MGMNTMVDIKYSEKEIAILNGMISLIKNGANPYRVKVSDIAKAAGVGKGTIYDYFKTKEEVMLKAMFYNVRQEIEIFIDKVNNKNSFEEKYFEMLNIIAENLQNEFSAFNIFISSGNLPDFHKEQFQEACAYYQKMHISMVHDEVDELLALGYKEGIIKEEENKYYQRMAIKSSLFVFGNYLSMKDIYKDTSLQEAMDYSYKLVMKSLN